MAEKIDKLADQVIGAVHGYVARVAANLSEQLNSLRGRLDALPPLDQLKGADGIAGKDGAPGERGEAGPAGEKGLNGADGATGPAGEKGEKGDPGPAGADGAPGAAGERGEKGEPGEPGARGEKGDSGQDGMAGERGERGERGLDGAPGERGERGEVGPPGEAGEPGPQGERGMVGAAGERGEKGDVGADGRDGDPGRDAPHVDVLDGIDQTRRYQRGTWASYRGGIIRSFRATDPLCDDAVLEKAGWQTVLRGIDAADIVLGADLRTVTLSLSFTDGLAVQKSITVPAIIDRGVWQERGYEPGDGVTWGGSFHIAQRATQPGEKPSDDSGAWRLSVKKGRDGRDGLRGEKGERGAEGRAGQDLGYQAPRGPI